MKAPKPGWQTSASSAELAAGYRAAKMLQSLPVPSPLAKQVANYLCRADAELAARGISAGKLTNVGLVALPPVGRGNSGYRRRQFETAARPTPANRAIPAVITSCPSWLMPVTPTKLHCQ